MSGAPPRIDQDTVHLLESKGIETIHQLDQKIDQSYEEYDVHLLPDEPESQCDAKCAICGTTAVIPQGR